VSKPGFRASIREPVPSTTSDCASPAIARTRGRSIVAPAAIRMSSSR
jgi:hypothetical protein